MCHICKQASVGDKAEIKHRNHKVMLAHTHTHTQTVKYVTVCITVSYLLDAISPALADTVPCPDVVCILSQFVHHGFLGGSQFDVTQVQRSRFITTRQLIAAQIELNH